RLRLTPPDAPLRAARAGRGPARRGPPRSARRSAPTRCEAPARRSTCRSGRSPRARPAIPATARVRGGGIGWGGRSSSDAGQPLPPWRHHRRSRTRINGRSSTSSRAGGVCQFGSRGRFGGYHLPRAMPTRWRVAVLVCAAIAISYLDRQALPVAVQAIQRDIPLTNTQFGDLTSTFLLA